MKGVARAYALIDIHNMERVTFEGLHERPFEVLADGILRIQQNLARCLPGLHRMSSTRVVLRMYHGWHRGRSPVQLHSIVERLVSQRRAERKIGRVSFDSRLEFGSDLVCGGPNQSLYSTHRSTGQKMVDTAIVSDFHYLLSQQLADLAIIVSDDDDFIPAGVVARVAGHAGYLMRPMGRTLEQVLDQPNYLRVLRWQDDT